MADENQQSASTYSATDYTLDGGRYPSLDAMQSSVTGGLPTANNAAPQTSAGLTPRIDALTQNQTALSSVEDLLKQKEGAMNQVPWFQLAAAFLNPGRTGSFGEALGGAAGTLGKWNEVRQEQMLPLAKAKLDIAAQKAAIQQQIAGQQALSKLFPEMGAPASGVSTPQIGSAPVGTQLGQPSMGTAPSGNVMGAVQPSAQPISAPQMPEITKEQVAKAQRDMDPNSAKIIEDAYKHQEAEKELAIKQRTEKVAEEAVKANLRGFSPEQTMSLEKKQNLEKLAAQAEESGNWTEYIKYAKKNGMPIYTRPDNSPMFPHEITNAAALSADQAKLEAQETHDFNKQQMANIQAAHNTIHSAEQIKKYAKASPAVFDRLTGSNAYDSLLNLASKSFNIPGVGTVGIDAKATDQFLQSIGITEKKVGDNDLKIARLILPHLANLAYETVQASKGSQISIPRQRLIEQLKPSASDDSQTMRIKAESFIITKEADLAIADAWGRARKNGMSSSDFLLSKEYNDIEKEAIRKQSELTDEVTAIYGKNPKVSNTIKSTSPTKQGVSPAAGFTQRFKEFKEKNKSGGTQ